MPASNEPPDFDTELWLAGFWNGLLIHTSDCLNSVHSVYIYMVQATVQYYTNFLFTNLLFTIVNKLFTKDFMACKP